jgi:hypothetical protein
MKFIKISYEVKDPTGKLNGKTIIICCQNKALTKFSSADLANFTYQALRQQGKKALYSRGMVVQFFLNKSLEEVTEIMRNDVKLGLMVASEKKKLELKDYKEEIIGKE